MPRKYKDARLAKQLKATEAAEKLGVCQPTLSAWERESKSPNIGSLERMADLYGVTTDYLLGRSNVAQLQPTVSVSEKVLPLLNGRPVWSPSFGWALVNIAKRVLLLFDGSSRQIADAGALFLMPFRFGEIPRQEPLSLSETMKRRMVWLEPISEDPTLRDELRGVYNIIGNFAENDCGNRFALHSYGTKWLAFDAEI